MLRRLLKFTIKVSRTAPPPSKRSADLRMISKGGFDPIAGRYPAVVAQIDREIIGWASAGPYRERECYRGIGEFSMYVRRDWRGRGVGDLLVAALVTEAERLGLWKLLSRIFTFNEASRALCRKHGFREVGVYEKHARLDGHWLDVVIVERLITANRNGVSL